MRGAFKDMPSLINFGFIDPDAQEAVQTLTLVHGDGGPISPKVIPHQSSGVTAEIREIKEGEHYEMTTRLTPPFKVGVFNGVLLLETGVAEAPREHLRVTATIGRRVQVVPSEFRLPSQVEQNTRRSVVVVWNTNFGHRVVNASCTDPRLEVKPVVMGRTQEVQLWIPAGYNLPDPPPTVTIQTDDPAFATLTVPVQVEEVKPPVVKPAP